MMNEETFLPRVANRESNKICLRDDPVSHIASKV